MALANLVKQAQASILLCKMHGQKLFRCSLNGLLLLLSMDTINEATIFVSVSHGTSHDISLVLAPQPAKAMGPSDKK